MIVTKCGGIVVLLQIVAEGRPRRILAKQGRRLAIEAAQIGQHAPEAPADQVSWLAEQAAQRAGVVLEAGRFVLRRKAHRGRLAGDAEFGEQACQQRVVGVVEDDEAGVDGMPVSTDFDLVGVGVAARPVVLLEQHDLVRARQQPGAGESGDARSDHGDAHQADLAAWAARIAAGTGLRSRTRPTAAIPRSRYQVRSNSHQRKPWRAAPGK